MYRVVECLGCTGLGDYEMSMKNLQDHLDWLEDFGYCSPYDLNKGEEYLQNAVDGILRSIKDGSLVSKKLFETIGFETEPCPDYECVA